MKLHYYFSENALQGTLWANIWLDSIVHGLTWANIMVHEEVHGWSWACLFLRILTVLHTASQYFDDIWYTNSHAGIIFRCRRSSNTSLYYGCRWYFISSLFCIDNLALEITNVYRADYRTCTGVLEQTFTSFVSIWNIDVDKELNMLLWWALSLAIHFMIAFPTSITIV